MNLVFFLVFVIVVLSPWCSFYVTPRNTCTSVLAIIVFLLLDYLWFKYNLLLLFRDVKLNPGPKKKHCKKNSIRNWNLNSIAAHNFENLLLLKAYNSVHKFDIICLSEAYLDSNILPDHSNFKIPGYNLVRSDYLSNKKRGGVCIYYKSYLPLRTIDINYLKECMRFELLVDGKICNFIALYRSLSRSQDLFQSFREALELNLGSAV